MKVRQAIRVADSQPSRRDTRLDKYVEQYAARASGFQVSAVRALFAVANRPEVVSLAGGMPNIADLPQFEIGATISKLIAERGAQAMQYGSGQGEIFIREKIVEVMAAEAICANADDVVITCGSQQGLDLVSRIFCDPGDVVLAEAPSYVGALSIFGANQCEVVHVETDELGIVPDAVRQAVTTLRAAGRKVKFCYTIPTFQNPTGSCQSVQRRQELIAVAQEVDLLVLEDNPYGLLGFDREPLVALRAMDSERVIYLGSFSKTFAPGFRVGWVCAPHAVREKLVLLQEAATLCPPVFSQFAIAEYLENFDWRAQIRAFADMYRERRDAMLQALVEHMPPGTTWTHPSGGFYVWLTLPDGLDSQAMLPRAVSARVAYTPGTAFYADERGCENIRLSFCYPTPARIIEGVKRLGEAIRSEQETHAIFRTERTARPGRHGAVINPAPDIN
ncbi:MAG: PLP-dependent aminotransferase family protein [Propionibacteriaceae bacterium]|nr:PLP-dependent aminotransferase family protein [Propionibacteriaceae bacterium]